MFDLRSDIKCRVWSYMHMPKQGRWKEVFWALLASLSSLISKLQVQ